MAQRIKYDTLSDFDMRYTDRCPTDSDPSEAPSEDSDNSSAAPPRRYRVSQKGSRSRNNKVRTLNRWTTEEHDKLAYLVDKWGSEKNWAKVAEEMPGRTGKQCRERWLNHMKPGIIKGNWSPEEEFLLAQCHALVGSHWSKMTKRLPGRTENSIKNFWNATLRSKAPNKKRGMLWTYMQLHDPKSDDNTLALVTAVSRLHETRELPPHLLAQLDEGLLDSRTWKAIHKAEKEFLENIGGELHYLSLPHPSAGGLAASAVPSLQGYCGGAAGAVAAAAASPAGSPVASSSQIPEYTAVSLGHQYSNSYLGKLQACSYLHRSSTTTDVKLADDPNSGLLSTAVPGAVGAAGTMQSAAANAAAYGLPSNLLTAQDPLLSCAAQDNSDHAELLRMFETSGASGHQNQLGGSTLGSCLTMAVNNGSVLGASDGFGGTEAASVTTVAAGGLDSCASGMPGPSAVAPKLEQQHCDVPGSSYSHAHCQLPGHTVSAPASANSADNSVATAVDPRASYGSHMQQHLSPVGSCEPGTGAAMDGSSLLTTISSGAELQQGTAASGTAMAGVAAHCGSNNMAATADYSRLAPGYTPRGDLLYGGVMVSSSGRSAAVNRPAGGHGPHCSCGPCSNSRKLHGLHSPGARRQARNTAAANNTQRYRSMASLASDPGMTAYQQASKLQRQSYALQPEHLAGTAGYQLLDAQAYQVMAQQQQQQQQYYSNTGCAVQQHPAGLAACAEDCSAGQAAAYQQVGGNAGLAAAAAPPAASGAASLQQRVQQQEGQPRCESPFAPHAAAGWDAPALAKASMPAMQPMAEQLTAAPAAEAVTAEAASSMPWLSTSNTQHQQQAQQEPPSEQRWQGQPAGTADVQVAAQPVAAGAAPAAQPPQQSTADSNVPPPIKGLDLSQLTLPGLGVADALTGFLLSPVGLGLLSPLGGLMLPPPSTRSVRLPSFGQITLPMQRTSINGCDWDWDALMASDLAHQPRSSRPSENGEALAAALAIGNGLSSAPRIGAKRARCSVTSVEDDAALLIDMQPAKVARSTEPSACFWQ